MHRLAFVLCSLMFLTACGGRRAQVSIPAAPPPAVTPTTAAPPTTAPPATPAPAVRTASTPTTDGATAPDRKTTIPASPATPAAGEMEGMASYYAEPYHGRRTASGEIFDSYKDMTAAHRTLPFNTVVRVTNKNNGKKVEVRINDRGPFVDGRVIDVSLVAARELDMVRTGVAPVRLDIVKEADEASQLANQGVFYSVQVGAFATLSLAEKLKRELERKYEDVTIQTGSGDKPIYRVRVGRDPDIMSAHKLAEKLRKESYDSVVVRVN